MQYNLLRAVTFFRLNQTTTNNNIIFHRALSLSTYTTCSYNHSRSITCLNSLALQIRGGSSSTSSTLSKNETMGDNNNTTNNTNSIWTISEQDNGQAFSSLDHVGYSLESDPIHHTGGWLAYQKALQPKRITTEGTITTTSTDDDNDTTSTTMSTPSCWIQEEIASKITKFDYSLMPIGRPPRILVLYGSLRPQSFSKKLAYEFARLLETTGCDVRVYNPAGLPVRDPSLESHVKVQELRSLTLWSDGHVWVSPEMHGQITGVFKNQIDWIPLNTGSIRPTQGRTCCVAQVNGGSQSFNAVNTLRLLARWMRMPCCTNQSSVPMAWKEFDDNGRMKESSYRDRVVDVAEEFAKFTAVMTPVSDDLVNRYSERKEKEKEGRLLTQAEKESKKTIDESRKG